MDIILDWFSTNYGWLISLLIQGFIAYHVFFLSKKLSNRARLEHKEKIKLKAEELLSDIYSNKLNSKVYLVNINRYFKDYPSNKERRLEGYSHISAEIKSTKFNGIEFFSEMPVKIYKKKNGTLSFNGKDKEEAFNVFPVGIVPYEWIEHIDLEGDEYAYVPLFYCHFNGKTNWRYWIKLLFFGYPYKRIVYYRKNEVYHDGSDPVEMKYSFIYEPINKN